MIYLDESIFSFRTFYTRAWSQKKQNLEIDSEKIKVDTMALIAAISEDEGLEDYLIHPRAISTE